MAEDLKHGLSYTPEYPAWQTMRHRCIEPKNPAYLNYGGRGIKICDRWLNSPQNFLDDMGVKPTPKHEIDRRDNDGHYEPGNCRWVTRKENCGNRRSNRHIEFQGETKTLTGWAEVLGLSPDVISKRLDAEWTLEAALLTPVRHKSPNGQAKSPKQCVDCRVRATARLRCITCSNKSRAKPLS